MITASLFFVSAGSVLACTAIVSVSPFLSMIRKPLSFIFFTADAATSYSSTSWPFCRSLPPKILPIAPAPPAIVIFMMIVLD